MKRTAFRLVLLVAAGISAACSAPARVDGRDADARAPVYRPYSRTAPAAAQNLPERRDIPALPDSPEARDASAALHTELIQTMLEQRQYYAALAHIEQIQRDGGGSLELRYLEAGAHRRLGQYREAEVLYQSLLKNKNFSGLAYHGLGRIAAERKDFKAAIQHLRMAAGRRPTDSEVRNDLGYALMLAGRYTEALPQFATAVELDNRDSQARNNLVILLILMRDEKGVKRVVSETGIEADQLSQLRGQAKSLAQSR